MDIYNKERSYKYPAKKYSNHHKKPEDRDSRRERSRTASTRHDSRSYSSDADSNKRHSKKSRRSRSKSPSSKVDSKILDRVKKPSHEERLNKLFSEFHLILPENYGRMQYKSTKSKEENKSINHWGQRKLFISELWFLTHYGHLAKTFIYAGAAPSTHTTYLMRLFPEHYFILIDPSHFNPKQLDPMPTNFEIINDYFTDDLARKLAEKYPGDILFVSDIRTADKTKQGADEVEQFVRNDNIKQMDWINIMKPKKSLLKFRCPYPSIKAGEQNLKMFKGQIYLQPWAPPKSSETRLVPDDSLEIIEYDNKIYEEQLYYHNMEVRRNKRFNQPITFGEGFDNRWDISAEILVIKQFFDKFPEFLEKKEYKELNLFEKIVKFSEDLSRYITLGHRDLTMNVHDQKPNHHAFDHSGFYKKERVATTLMDEQFKIDFDKGDDV